MAQKLKVTIKNIYGEYRGLDIFQFFDDGIRKRLPKGVAEDFKSEIIKNIDRNTFGFELSKRWVDFKRRIGADTRPFIMFNHYKNSISIITEAGHLSVGFKKTTMHPRAKMSMGKLAILLEYGDLAKGIPARPLWRKTADRYFKTRKGNVGKLIEKTLNSRK